MIYVLIGWGVAIMVFMSGFWIGKRTTELKSGSAEETNEKN